MFVPPPSLLVLARRPAQRRVQTDTCLLPGRFVLGGKRSNRPVEGVGDRPIDVVSGLLSEGLGELPFAEGGRGLRDRHLGCAGVVGRGSLRMEARARLSEMHQLGNGGRRVRLISPLVDHEGEVV